MVSKCVCFLEAQVDIIYTEHVVASLAFYFFKNSMQIVFTGNFKTADSSATKTVIYSY